MASHALLFTDIVDSTALVERLGDDEALRVWAQHDRRTRELIAMHHGREIDRTDGFFLLFEDTRAAVSFALAYHEMLAELSLRARVGIHFANVHLRPIRQRTLPEARSRSRLKAWRSPSPRASWRWLMEDRRC